MVKRKIDWKVYGIAAFVTFIIFISGISFGLFLNKEKIGILRKSLQDLQIYQEDNELQFTISLSLAGKKPCTAISNELNRTIDMADALGKKVEYYESERIKDSEYYLLKKQYTLTLIRYWLFWEMMKQDCNQTVDTIIYFYSNERCFECLQQSTVLSYLKQNYPYRIMTFALDYDMDLKVINLMKDIYDIDMVPTTIINGKKYAGLQNLGQIKSILNIT